MVLLCAHALHLLCHSVVHHMQPGDLDHWMGDVALRCGECHSILHWVEPLLNILAGCQSSHWVINCSSLFYIYIQCDEVFITRWYPWIQHMVPQDTGQGGEICFPRIQETIFFQQSNKS